MARRALQAALLPSPARAPAAQRVAAEIAHVQLRLTESLFYSMQALPLLWSILRVVNQSTPAGPSPALAQSYVILGIIAATMPPRRIAHALCRKALDIAVGTGSRRDLAWVLTRIACVQIATGQWDEARAGTGRALAIIEELGDARLWEEWRALTSYIEFFTGAFAEGLAHADANHRLGRGAPSQQAACWRDITAGDNLLRLGQAAAALDRYERALERMDPQSMRSEFLEALGMSALARLHLGDRDGAFEAADRALAYIGGTQPVAYWTQGGTAATAEVFLTLLETTPARAARMPQHALLERARQACVGLRRYAQRFPHGRAHALLNHGRRAWLLGRRRSAMHAWHRAVLAATRLGTPWEAARAHFEIGRHLAVAVPERRRHLDRALETFQHLGCTRDVAIVRDELERGRRLAAQEIAIQ